MTAWCQLMELMFLSLKEALIGTRTSSVGPVFILLQSCLGDKDWGHLLDEWAPPAWEVERSRDLPQIPQVLAGAIWTSWGWWWVHRLITCQGHLPQVYYLPQWEEEGDVNHQDEAGEGEQESQAMEHPLPNVPAWPCWSPRCICCNYCDHANCNYQWGAFVCHGI